MQGADNEPEEEEAGNSASEDDPATRRKYAKRNSGRALVRTSSTDEYPLFAHDNAPKLAMELVHEAGASAQVCIHGTPAAGVGVFAMMEKGCLVVALAQDDFHAKQLRASVLDRMKKAIVSGTSRFSSQELFARKLLLDPPKSAKKRRAEEIAKEEDGSEAEPSISGEFAESSESEIEPKDIKPKEKKSKKEKKTKDGKAKKNGKSSKPVKDAASKKTPQKQKAKEVNDTPPKEKPKTDRKDKEKKSK